MWSSGDLRYGTSTEQQDKRWKSRYHRNNSLACHSQGKRKGLSSTNIRKRFNAINKKFNYYIVVKTGKYDIGKTYNFNSV